MVIKVIYKGKKKEKWKGKCEECSSVMEADSIDLQFEEEEDKVGLAACPVCDGEEYVTFYEKKQYDRIYKGGK